MHDSRQWEREKKLINILQNKSTQTSRIFLSSCLTCYTTCVCQFPMTPRTRPLPYKLTHTHHPIHLQLTSPPPRPSPSRWRRPFHGRETPPTCSVCGRSAHMLDAFFKTARPDSWSVSGAARRQNAEWLWERWKKCSGSCCAKSRPEASTSDSGGAQSSDEIKPRQKKLTGKTLSQLLGKGEASAARRPITGEGSLPPASLVGWPEEVGWRWEEIAERKKTLTPPVISSFCPSLDVLLCVFGVNFKVWGQIDRCLDVISGLNTFLRKYVNK